MTGGTTPDNRAKSERGSNPVLSNTRGKFTLYNVAGLGKAYYLVDTKVVNYAMVEESLEKAYDYQVFLSKSAKIIKGSSGSLKVLGVEAEDDCLFYKYQQITKEIYDKLISVPVVQTDLSVLVFARANLDQGYLNTAKYALVSSFDTTLTEKHAKALTNVEITEFARDLEEAIFEPAILDNHVFLNGIEVNKKISLWSLIKLLEEDKSNIIINFKHLRDNYQRQSAKRIEGTRDKDGKVIKPQLKTEHLDDAEYVQMGSVAVNHNTATINMLITKKVKLVDTERGNQISEVAGMVVTELNKFRNYTIVSDGEVNLKSLKVKISSKKVFELLKSKGVITKNSSPAEEFDFRVEWDLRLDNLPLVDFDSSFGSIEGLFKELAAIKILSSILSAHLQQESAVYIHEQLEEMQKNYLSKSVYINFPTTTEYSDLEEAIASGNINSRIVRKIDIGSKEILNLGKLYSANKFLNRLYEGYNQDTGEQLEKLSFDITLNENIIFGHKYLSSRLKLTKVDELMRQIFDNFLGIEDHSTVVAILLKTGAEALLPILQARWRGEDIVREELVAAFLTANNKLKEYTEKIYREKVSPLVFYIGATGLISDHMDGIAETAEAIGAKYGDLQFSKHERQGTFFEVGDSIISVYPKKEYYSTTV
ncbi:MAG: VWA domain-containing protein [Symploca sp. SIO2E9]|nr:VWA domain-containing protein [Symploca sp. SIO2E9]